MIYGSPLNMTDRISKTMVILRTLFSFICPQHFIPINNPSKAKGIRSKTDLRVPGVSSPRVLYRMMRKVLSTTPTQKTTFKFRNICYFKNCRQD